MSKEKIDVIRLKMKREHITNSRIPFDVLGLLMFLECIDEDVEISANYLLGRGLTPSSLAKVEGILIEKGVWIKSKEEPTIN
ncbi:hypothetical protein AB832_08290 [Flavobacteriaceae bacterium (ex Bugula neritina AB1)]|jgi:hypothetical protein|nr:hypothetical protein AB832_08290 [Flavobacteriaceae bacterium (ex Bugula neritina AB1)]